MGWFCVNESSRTLTHKEFFVVSVSESSRTLTHKEFFVVAKRKARQLENKAGTKGAKAEEMCGK